MTNPPTKIERGDLIARPTEEQLANLANIWCSTHPCVDVCAIAEDGQRWCQLQAYRLAYIGEWENQL